MKRIDKVNIVQEKWDYLIILDACRYDYFEHLYKDYFDGNLAKRISMGSSTGEWRDKSFPDNYEDIIYISANPQFCIDSEVYGFTAGGHFHKVYEIWKTGWDKEKGTVLPETLTKMASDIIKKTVGKRFIIHYLQPHAPYLELQEGSKGYNDVNSVTDSQKGIEGYELTSAFKQNIFKKLLKLFENTKLLGNHPDWVLRKMLRMPCKAPMEWAWRNAGKEGLRKAYRRNLELVLEQVAELIKGLSGRIVITSDHGELLGENKSFGHPHGSIDPIQIEVPWLVIEKHDRTGRTQDAAVDEKTAEEPPVSSDAKDDQQELADKLRALGYYD
jgi:hypothetical protein